MASDAEYYTSYLHFDTHIDSSLIWSIFFMVTSDMKCVGDPKKIVAIYYKFINSLYFRTL